MTLVLEPLLKAIGSRAADGLDYVELRADSILQTSIEQRQSESDSISRRMELGHSARVLRDGRWGFAVSDGMNDVESTIREASGAALALGRMDHQGASLSSVSPVRISIRSKAKIPLSEVPLDQKISYLASLCQETSKEYDGITSVRANYTEMTGERALVTSEGAEVTQEISHAYLMTTASGKGDGRLVSSRDEVCSVTSGWELFSSIEPRDIISDRLARKIRQQIEGVPCKRGTFPCVISPRVAGMLAHEALGHLTEADFFASGAFSGLEGKQVAPANVTMVDDPSIGGGFGDIELDDEGVVPRRVYLIKEGFLGDLMTNREWAARLGTVPTGNARAENYRVPPIIRMRNTYFEKGELSFEELLEGKRFGYYCADIRGGQAEANSSFQVGIQECFEIIDGEIGRPVRSMAISGVATESLMMIDGLGRDSGFESSYCGKLNQYIATSDGGPPMSLKEKAIVFGGAD